MRIRRQRLVAVLAGRSKFKHGTLDVRLPEMNNQWFLEPFLIPEVELIPIHASSEVKRMISRAEALSVSSDN